MLGLSLHFMIGLWVITIWLREFKTKYRFFLVSCESLARTKNFIRPVFSPLRGLFYSSKVSRLQLRKFTLPTAVHLEQGFIWNCWHLIIVVWVVWAMWVVFTHSQLLKWISFYNSAQSSKFLSCVTNQNEYFCPEVKWSRFVHMKVSMWVQPWFRWFLLYHH